MLDYRELSIKIRVMCLKMIYTAREGHIGSSLSCVDILISLYFDVMKIDVNRPRWIDRDRFVLSKGHAAPALYVILAIKGFFPLDTLKTFRQYNSILQGHPDMTKTPGIDMSSGSLGNGLACSVGMALWAKKNNKKYNIYTLIGDGEMQEGIIWEAAMTASHFKLDNLIVILDYNKLQINGKVADIMNVENIQLKWEAFGWKTVRVDGHNLCKVSESIIKMRDTRDGRPSIVIADTIKGKGILYMENKPEWHSKIPNENEFFEALELLKRGDTIE